MKIWKLTPGGAFAVCLALGAVRGDTVDTDTPGSPPSTSNADQPAVLLPTRDLRIHFAPRQLGASAPEQYTLHYTRDGERSWTVHDKTHAGPSPLPFTAPNDGTFGFFVTARDGVGIEEPGPAPGTSPTIEVIVDTTPPRIRILRPDPDYIPITTSMEIEWEVDDDHLGDGPIQVAYSRADGRWVAIWDKAPAHGRREWLMPFTQGQLRLRFTARDSAGNVDEATVSTADVLSPYEIEKPLFLIVPSHSRRLAVPIYYRLETASGELLTPDRLQKVMVWYRAAGGSWTAGDLDRDRRSPLVFHAPGDGHYDVVLLAVAASGEILPREIFHGADTPPPSATFPHGNVLVDTREPRVAILEPLPGSRYQWQSPMHIRFSVREENPERAPPAVEYSVDRGGTWSTYPGPVSMLRTRRDGESMADLTFHLPAVETREFLLRVTARDLAGNSGASATPAKAPIHVGNFREDPREAAERLYRRAILLLGQTRPEGKQKAVGLLEAAITKWEPFAAAHHDLAVALEHLHSGSVDDQICSAILNHYRRALELAPDDLVLRFSVIEGFLRLEKELDAAPRNSLRRDARDAFRTISWAELLAQPETDEEQRRLVGFRKTYIRWNENEFAGFDEEFWEDSTRPTNRAPVNGADARKPATRNTEPGNEGTP